MIRLVTASEDRKAHREGVLFMTSRCAVRVCSWSGCVCWETLLKYMIREGENPVYQHRGRLLAHTQE